MRALQPLKECLNYLLAPFYLIFQFLYHTKLISDSIRNIPGIEGNVFIAGVKFVKYIFSYRTPIMTTCVSAGEVACGLNLLYGKEGLVKFWILAAPTVAMTKAKAAKALLKSKENVEKSNEYSFAKRWLRNGLLTSDADTWRAHRKLLGPTMYPKIIDSYLHIFQEQSLILAKKLGKTAGEKVEFLPLISYCTLDIICETAMGIQLHIQDKEDSKYLKSIHTLCQTVIDRIARIWLWSDFLFGFLPRGKRFYEALRYTRGFTKKIIDERKSCIVAARTDNNNMATDDVFKKNLSFLDLALDLHLSHRTFTLDNVQDEVEVFLFGGHDTSAVTISWALYLLGHNEEIQRKVHEELDHTYGSDPDVPVTHEDLKHLRYLECVIKETLRLYPPIPVIGRKLRQDLTIGDKTLLRGTTTMVVITEIHRDPEIYPEPEVFNPDRFLPNGSAPLDPYAFLAFSAGPRGCPGSKFAYVQMKTILSNVLRRFKVRSSVHRDKMVLSVEMVQRPLAGFSLIFEHRLP